jgi:ribosome biogenesis GTP-binding protein YsxC/EngB
MYRRAFCSGATGASFRQRLRAVQVCPKTKRYIDELGLGMRRSSPGKKNGAAAPPQVVPAIFGRRPKVIATATDEWSLPEAHDPEVAFVGRSNVGKSSLLNAVMRTRGLARVSERPGETQSINFYQFGKVPQSISLVDLPGYGFAFAEAERMKQWTHFFMDYLQSRKTLRRVFVLVDSRHGLKESDLQMCSHLDKAKMKYQVGTLCLLIVFFCAHLWPANRRVLVQLVMTKADLLKPDMLGKMAGLINERVASESVMSLVQPMQMVSSVSRRGKEGAGVAKFREHLAQVTGKA